MKNIFFAKFFRVVAVLCALLPANVQAEVNESVVNDYEIEKLNSNSLWNWQVYTEERSGHSTTLFGSLTNAYELESEEVGNTIIQEYSRLLGLENPLVNFELTDVVKDAGINLIYTQTYDNIPVEKSYLLISITPDKRISLIKSRIYLINGLDTVPQLSEDEIYNIAFSDANNEWPISNPGDIKSVIIPSETITELGWIVKFRTEYPMSEIRYIINDNGSIIDKIIENINVPQNDITKLNPITGMEDVKDLLGSLNTAVPIREFNVLIEMLSNITDDDYRDVVALSLITSDLNINGGRNLRNIIEVLYKKAFLRNEVFLSMSSILDVTQPFNIESSLDQPILVSDVLPIEDKLVNNENIFVPEDSLDKNETVENIIQPVVENLAPIQRQISESETILPQPLPQNTIETQLAENLVETYDKPFSTHYIVQEGDTLSAIASYYGISEGRLAEINNYVDINPGVPLLTPPPVASPNPPETMNTVIQSMQEKYQQFLSGQDRTTNTQNQLQTASDPAEIDAIKNDLILHRMEMKSAELAFLSLYEHLNAMLEAATSASDTTTGSDSSEGADSSTSTTAGGEGNFSDSSSYSSSDTTVSGDSSENTDSDVSSSDESGEDSIGDSERTRIAQELQRMYEMLANMMRSMNDMNMSVIRTLDGGSTNTDTTTNTGNEGAAATGGISR